MEKFENENQMNMFLNDMHIDTKTASINFSKQLLEFKTYFLNGEWGTGKTEFLKETQKFSDKKFVYLDLWQVKDERSVMAIAFNKIHPILSIIFKTIFIVCVVISLLMTNVVNFGLTNIFNSTIFLIAGIIALFVAVWSFFKVKSDSFFNLAFKCKWLKISKKVLVIDDFDRASVERQQQAYQVFNLLNNRMTIVFVGDYNNLANNTSKYLQKIVNRRVELPFVLNPNNIWHSYFKELSTTLKADISEKLIDVIISENRNLREREQFNDFVNQEFFKRGKINHVQVNDQLWVIYIFLFHQDYYNKLVKNEKFKLSNEIINQAENDWHSLSATNKLRNCLARLQSYNTDAYPQTFSKARLAYLIYEVPANLTEEELESQFEDDYQLKVDLLSNSDTDFYQYLVVNYSNFSNERKSKLLSTSLELVKLYKESNAINFVVQEKMHEITSAKEFTDQKNKIFPHGPFDEEGHKEIYKQWTQILFKNGFDLSLILYFLETFKILNFYNLGIQCQNIDYSEKQTRIDFLLLVYISSRDMWKKFSDWHDSLWEKICSLPDDQFLTFCIKQEIISNVEEIDRLEFLPDNKNYIFWTEKYSFDPPFRKISQGLVLEKIGARLGELKRKGYTFVNKVDDRNKWDV